MFDDVKVIQGEETVKKLVFTKKDAVAEAVLYRYPEYTERTVICSSSQSGCPCACRFCGSGNYFVRSLTTDEIVFQVDRAIEESKTDPAIMKRLQIMFMSMGEPLLNKNAMIGALEALYEKYPNAALLISTIGPKIDYEWVYEISERIPNIGLQFSIHKSNDDDRNKLIPFKKKLNLQEIAETGTEWKNRTGRKPFFNYCAGPDNNSQEDADILAKIFNPEIWECTISVICEQNEGLPAKNEYQLQLANDFSSKMLQNEFNVRVFDPAGQDTIGGGCGQLWRVQQWFNENPDKAKPSIGHGLPKVHTPVLTAAE